MNRRVFLGCCGGALAGLAAAPFAGAAPAPRLALRKALKLSMVEVEGTLLDRFRLAKAVGFEGIELESPNELPMAEVLAARDATGLPIHGVVDSLHWKKTLGDPDAAVRAEGLEALRQALSDARQYGATTVLLVPAVVNKQIGYAEAYARSSEAIRTALPYAESKGVRIALENVWNSFLLSPLEFAGYIDQFRNPWIGAYFDVGNIINYGWPEQWIHALGARILKVDIKGYSRRLRDAEGPWAGFKTPIGEDDNDWPAVRAALAAVGYSGWVTAEVPGGGEAALREIAERMDRHVLAAG